MVLEDARFLLMQYLILHALERDLIMIFEDTLSTMLLLPLLIEIVSISPCILLVNNHSNLILGRLLMLDLSSSSTPSRKGAPRRCI